MLPTHYTDKGRQDEKSIGAVAILNYAGKEWGHAEHVFGDQVTRSDAEVSTVGLTLTIQHALHFLGHAILTLYVPFLFA